MGNKAVLTVVLSLALIAPAGSLRAQAGAAPPPDLMYSISYVQSNLVKGKTTRADVISSFGAPAHQRVRASDSGASETLYYKRGSQAAASGGGVAKATRSIGSIAGGLGRMMGYSNGGSQAYEVSNQANNIASGMESMSGASASAQPAMSGPSTITVEIVNGVVSSYSME